MPRGLLVLLLPHLGAMLRPLSPACKAPCYARVKERETKKSVELMAAEMTGNDV